MYVRSALPPDSRRLRTLERQLTIWLDSIRRAIVRAEAHEAQQQRDTERAVRGPGWKIEAQRMRGDGIPWRVHLGDCALGKGRSRDADQAPGARSRVEACEVCWPDSALGVLG
jgi:hypothetical protein